MVPGVRHLLARRHGQLQVHGRHGDGALLDPACEPGDESEPPAGMEVEEPADHFLTAGLLRSLDELSVSRTCEISETHNLMEAPSD